MTKPINVLSVCDGIACGYEALKRAGININRYYSSEIDKYAIQIAKKNHPDIIPLGDINNWKKWEIDWSSVDLLIGGTPCQGFSFAGKQLNFMDKRSRLFFVYFDILNHLKSVNPNIRFLLENVKMKKEYQDIISKHLGIYPVEINSALVSAQNRKRLYWTNISLIQQPQDKGILVKDIIEPDVFAPCDKTHAIIARIGRTTPREYFKKNQGQLFPLKADKLIKAGSADIKGHDYNRRVYSIEGKSPALTAASGGNHEPKFAFGKYWRKVTPLECERLQTLPDNYTEGVSNSQRYKMLGNAWTVAVIVHVFNYLKAVLDREEAA